MPVGSAACDIDLVLDRAIAETPKSLTMTLAWSPLKTPRQRIRRYEFEILSHHVDIRELAAMGKQKVAPREDKIVVFRSIRHQVKRYWRNLKRAKNADTYWARYAVDTPAEFLGREKFESRLPRINEHVVRNGTLLPGGRLMPREVLDLNDIPQAKPLPAPRLGRRLVAADLIQDL